MINAKFAQDFITKVNHQLQYNINIMNDRAIIIASSSPERIGDFHACAYEILTNRTPIHITEKVSGKMAGVSQPGVNLLIQDGLEPVGVLGVSGNLDEVLPIAKTIKIALESLLEYQGNIELGAAYPLGDKLAYALLFEIPQDPSHILKMMKRANVSARQPRMPVLINFSGVEALACSTCFAEIYPAISSMDVQDILLQLDHNHLLLLKSIQPDPILSNADYIKELILHVNQKVTERYPNTSESIKCFCGPIQSDIFSIRTIYECLVWLENRSRHIQQQVLFFEDFVLDYLVCQSNESMLSIFFENSYQTICKKFDLSTFQMTVRALIDANMKAEIAAQLLYMHKNTIMARIHKIKDCLHINPLSNVKDAAFLIALYEYSIMRAQSKIRLDLERGKAGWN